MDDLYLGVLKQLAVIRAHRRAGYAKRLCGLFGAREVDVAKRG